MKNQELWEAVHAEDYARAKQLLEGIDRQLENQYFISKAFEGEQADLFGWASRDEEGDYTWQFPLVEAARTGNLAIAKLLRKHCATTNPKQSEPALHAAFSVRKETSPGIYEWDRCKSFAMIKYLVEEGAYINASGPCPTPLQRAIALNDVEIVEYLLQHRADVNMPTCFSNGKNALALAIQEQNLAMVKLLIAYGVDPSIGASEGKTPLEQAKELGNTEIIDALLQREIEVAKIRELLQAIEREDTARVEELLRQGVNPNRGFYIQGMGYPRWIYSLITAAHTQNLSLAKLLVHYGASVNITETSDGATPLHSASSPALITYLVEQGANVNAEGGFCLTPLLLAIHREDIEMVEYLIQQGADVNKCLSSVDENESRTTAVGTAVQKNNLPILELLIKYGAQAQADHFYGTSPLEEAKEMGNEKIIEALRKVGYDEEKNLLGPF